MDAVIYRFGDFELLPERYELLRRDEQVPLEPRVLEVLSYLVTHRDRTVAKTELLEELWQAEFVTESALSRAIRELRKALGDSAKKPRFLKTVYGRGYLFIGEVEESERRRASSAGAAEVGTVADRSAVAAVGPSDAPAAYDTEWARGPFVGRQLEMGQLTRALDDAIAHRGRLVMLVGDPGIGKTRTAQALAREAVRRGMTVLWGRSLEGWRAPPYWPWVQVIRSYLDGVDPVTLDDEMGAGAGDIAEIVPEVRATLPDLEPVPSLEDPEQARFRLFDSIGRFLRRASLRRPIMLVLDNLHWSDRPSLRLLEMLAHELVGSRLAVVGTYRDTELSRRHPLSDTLGALGREGLFERLHLKGLSRDESADFVAEVAPARVPEPLVDAVYRQTEGNPFFLSEVVRLLAQEGVLASAESPARWRPRLVPELRIPEGVQEVVGRRLNQLSDECNRVLGTAAVVGRFFDLGVLERLFDDLSGESLLADLEEATQAGLLQEVPRVHARYQFTHALIRETLYDELSTARRVQRHRQIAEVLEQVHATNLDAHLPLLAHHFFEAAPAGVAARAVEYCERGGRRAIAQLAVEEAVWFFHRALEVLELVEPVDTRRSCQLLLELGRALRGAGEMREAIEVFMRAAAIAREIDSPEALAEAALGVQLGLYAEPAVRLLKEALDALPEGDSVLRVRLLSDLAMAYFFVGRSDRGKRISTEALEMARRLDDPWATYAALRAGIRTFNALHAGPGWEEGVDLSSDWLDITEEMLALSEKLGETSALVDVHGFRVHSFLARGDIGAVRAEVECYDRRAERLRQPVYRCLSPINRATLATLEGRFEDAERLLVEARTVGSRVGFANIDGVFSLQMFTLRRLQGRLGEIGGIVEHFVSHRSGAAVWRPGLALVYVELGRLDAAREVFEPSAANGFSDIPRDPLWMTCLCYFAEVAVALGSMSGIDALYELIHPSRHGASTAGGIAYLGAMPRYLGELATARESWREAEEHFEAALERDERLGARPWIATTQASYAAMLLKRAEPGDAERARAMLQAASSLAGELQMKGLQGRARRTLAAAPGRLR